MYACRQNWKAFLLDRDYSDLVCQLRIRISLRTQGSPTSPENHERRDESAFMATPIILEGTDERIFSRIFSSLPWGGESVFCLSSFLRCIRPLCLDLRIPILCWKDSCTAPTAVNQVSRSFLFFCALWASNGCSLRTLSRAFFLLQCKKSCVLASLQMGKWRGKSWLGAVCREVSREMLNIMCRDCC